jgi:ADP-heptose:LPS heptosyltransferase
MDLVITIDSSPVHIAGAIGKETWLLLPYRYEWRWGLEGENTHWYESVRVLRQKKHGDWGTLLSEVFDQRLPERMCLKGKLI